MNHEHANFKPLDPGRINAIDPIEVRYWCRELHCSERELMEAVNEVGEHVAEVRQALHGKRTGH
jgi:hypothetical protein